MSQNRSNGILMDVCRLPGKFGIGDFGENAFPWIDILDQTGTLDWQILPLNPTGCGNSPDQVLSAFAGNLMFIELEGLLFLGLLTEKDRPHPPDLPSKSVDFEYVVNMEGRDISGCFLGILEGKAGQPLL